MSALIDFKAVHLLNSTYGRRQEIVGSFFTTFWYSFHPHKLNCLLYTVFTNVYQSPHIKLIDGTVYGTVDESRFGRRYQIPVSRVRIPLTS